MQLNDDTLEQVNRADVDMEPVDINEQGVTTVMVQEMLLLNNETLKQFTVEVDGNGTEPDVTLKNHLHAGSLPMISSIRMLAPLH